MISNCADNKPASNLTIFNKLPEIATAKCGFNYYPRNNMWIIKDNGVKYIFDFDEFYFVLESLIVSLKLYLIYVLKKRHPNKAKKAFRSVYSLTKHVHEKSSELVETISADNVLGYASLSKHKIDSTLLELRSLLPEWYGLGYLNIDSETSTILYKVKLKYYKSGTIVRTHHPTKGPFNEYEYRAITDYLLNNYASGIIDLSDLTLGFLCMVFGARPISFAMLRIKDFIERKDHHGITNYAIKIPAAKRKKSEKRTRFNTRKLTPEFGKLIHGLIEQIKIDFQSHINLGVNPLDLPIFPRDTQSANPVASSQHLYHKMQKCFSSGEPILCMREGLEGQPLKVNPKRFRHTVGTRMAEEGKREREIAEALGHVSVKSCRVYIEATGKIRKNINDKLATEIKPIARYFLGEVIHSESDATRGSDPASRIRCFNGSVKGEVIGSCGKSGFCGGFVPIPCYSCRNFQPWVDAPHHEVLDWLLTERTRKFDLTGDVKYASVNDHIIQNIMDIISRCNQMAANNKGINNG